MNTCFQEKYVFLFFFLLKTLIDMYFRHMVLTCFSIIWKCILTLIWGSSLEVDNRLSDKCCLVDLPMKDTTICILIIRLFIQDYVANKARHAPAFKPCKHFLNLYLTLGIWAWSWYALIIAHLCWRFAQELEHLHSSLDICTVAWTFTQEPEHLHRS